MNRSAQGSSAAHMYNDICIGVYLPKRGIEKHWNLCYSHSQSLGNGHPLCLFEGHLRNQNA